MPRAWVVVTLLAGIAGTTWGLFREARANTRLAESLVRERQANADLSTANAKVQERYNLAFDAIKTFHTGVSEDFLLREEKFKDSRNRLLKSASDFYGKLSALLGKETDLESRRALAQSNFEVAELTRNVGRSEDALMAHRAVLAAREALAAEPVAGPAAKTDVGRSLNGVASLLASTGKADDALTTYRHAESLLAGLDGSCPAARAALADCRIETAMLLRYAKRHDEALAACVLARVDLEALTAVPGAAPDVHAKLAKTIIQMGDLRWVLGRPTEAVQELRMGLAIYRKLADLDPGVAEFRRGLGISHFYLGNVLPLTGKTAEAQAEFRTSLEIGHKLLNDNPAVTRLRRNLVLSRLCFTALLLEMGKPAEAEAECRNAVRLIQELVNEDPNYADLRFILSQCHMTLGVVLLQVGKRAEAEVECRKAQAIAESDYGQITRLSPSTTAHPAPMAFGSLGDVVHSSGRTAEAKSFYDRAIALLEQRFKEEPLLAWAGYPIVYSMTVDSTMRRGLTLRELGDHAEAAADTRQALRMCDGLPPLSGSDLFETACCHAALAGLAGRAGSGVSLQPSGEEEATKAMEWLGKEVANGYRNTNKLRIESALDPLRDRADFKKLMAELEKNDPPQFEKK